MDGAAVFVARDEVRGFEYAQVLEDGRERHGVWRGEVADGEDAGFEAMQHITASRVAERGENQVEFPTVNHKVNFMIKSL